MEREKLLGEFIGSHRNRDAIHVAIAPVVAGCSLKPGQAIEMKEGEPGTVVASKYSGFGIVDPFLWRGPEPGERFYAVLYPNSVTSLRHEWSHDDFPAEGASPDDHDAEVRLREYARDQDVSYERLIEIMECGHRGGDEQMETTVPAEIWSLYEIVTGEKVEENDQRREYMRCDC